MARTLNNTAILVLGMVANGNRNGYEIQQAVERSTRYFWTASPGGIYPELKRLEAAGLLRSADAPRGAARRLSYELTTEGRAALAAWLRDEDALFEMRNEELLRLFFAAELPPAEQRAILERIGAAHERKAHDLEHVTAPTVPEGAPAGKRLVLDYGIAMHRGAAAWCRAAADRLGD